MSQKIRPTKKQKQMLGFIEGFINQHGYSPSYREIANGLNYTSVATVALHISNLIKRGHLRNRQNQSRSLEVVEPALNNESSTHIKPAEEKWLVNKVEEFFKQLETASDFKPADLDELYVLMGALKVLGLDDAAASFMPRLEDLKQSL